MTDEYFDPIDYGFRWTEDWYEFNRSVAIHQARKARDAHSSASSPSPSPANSLPSTTYSSTNTSRTTVTLLPWGAWAGAATLTQPLVPPSTLPVDAEPDPFRQGADSRTHAAGPRPGACFAGSQGGAKPPCLPAQRACRTDRHAASRPRAQAKANPGIRGR